MHFNPKWWLWVIALWGSAVKLEILCLKSHHTVIIQTMKVSLPFLNLCSFLPSIIYFPSVHIHKYSYPTLQVISCLKCSQRAKQCSSVLNAEYWLICGGGEERLLGESVKIPAIPVMNATGKHPSASHCDSSNYHSTRAELYFWEIGHLHTGRPATSK